MDFKIFDAESDAFGVEPVTAMLTITSTTNRIPPSAPYRSHFVESSIAAPSHLWTTAPADLKRA